MQVCAHVTIDEANAQNCTLYFNHPRVLQVVFRLQETIVTHMQVCAHVTIDEASARHGAPQGDHPLVLQVRYSLAHLKLCTLPWRAEYTQHLRPAASPPSVQLPLVPRMHIHSTYVANALILTPFAIPTLIYAHTVQQLNLSGNSPHIQATLTACVNSLLSAMPSATPHAAPLLHLLPHAATAYVSASAAPTAPLQLPTGQPAPTMAAGGSGKGAPEQQQQQQQQQNMLHLHMVLPACLQQLGAWLNAPHVSGKGNV